MLDEAILLGLLKKNGSGGVTPEEKAAWNAKYDLPTDGIPSTDLSDDVNADIADGVSALEKAEDIEELIPPQASSSNELADKAFVNSSVQTATANFRGNWSDWAGVPTDATQYTVDYSGEKTPSTNDYMVVVDASGYVGQTLDGTWRFKYGGTWATDGKAGWHPEYQVNETPLTAAQLAALNSDITAAKVSAYDTHIANNDIHVTSEQKTAWSNKQDAISDLSTIRSNAANGQTAYTMLSGVEELLAAI